MSTITRYSYSPDFLKKSPRSYLLLGPKGTGKSSFVKKICKKNKTPYIDLAKPNFYSFLRNHPALLSSLTDQDFVVIDDIQKLPRVLNEVHRMMEDQGKQFLIVADHVPSNPKKIMTLIKDRIELIHLFPLTWFELEQASSFELQRYLKRGGLPEAYLKKRGEDYLHHYTDSYLQEHLCGNCISPQEGPGFIKFLEYAAGQNSKIVCYQKTAQKINISPSLARRYYQILKDHLLGFSVPPWQSLDLLPRFYFFDPGMTYSLQKSPTPSLKAFIACELRSYLGYRGLHWPLRYWKKSIDFIILDKLAIRVNPPPEDSLKEARDFIAKAQGLQFIVVTQDPPATTNREDIFYLHWKDFLSSLWGDRFFHNSFL